jgi:photosystem I subunit II
VKRILSTMAFSVRARATFSGKAAPSQSRAARVVVRAEAAEASASEAKPWTPPTLDPNTPSPIFGGSTGGLLRKAQVMPYTRQSRY